MTTADFGTPGFGPVGTRPAGSRLPDVDRLPDWMRPPEQSNAPTIPGGRIPTLPQTLPTTAPPALPHDLMLKPGTNAKPYPYGGSYGSHEVTGPSPVPSISGGSSSLGLGGEQPPEMPLSVSGGTTRLPMDPGPAPNLPQALPGVTGPGLPDLTTPTPPVRQGQPKHYPTDPNTGKPYASEAGWGGGGTEADYERAYGLNHMTGWDDDPFWNQIMGGGGYMNQSWRSPFLNFIL